MGTSSTYGGPSGKSTLLPPWAQPEGGVDVPTIALPSGDGQPPVTSPPAAITLPSPTVTWGTAKGAMTRYAAGGGREALRKAGHRYVAAKGGARSAARTAISGRAATASLGNFLANVVNRGGDAAARVLGLARVIGKGADAVFAALVDALAPSGAELEEAAARKAVEEAIEHIYKVFDLEDGDLTKLDAMDADTVTQVLSVSVCTYIYHRWLQELGKSIQEKAVGQREAVRLERDVLAYIREAVKLDFQNVDVLRIRWNGDAGRAIVNRIYSEAYGFLETE